MASPSCCWVSPAIGQRGSDLLEMTRPFTQYQFREIASPVRSVRAVLFFKALDLVLTGRPDFQLQDAAEGRIGSRYPAGASARCGAAAGSHRLAVLFSHGEPQPGLEPFITQQVNGGERKRRCIEAREVWSLHYEGGLSPDDVGLPPILACGHMAGPGCCARSPLDGILSELREAVGFQYQVRSSSRRPLTALWD